MLARSALVAALCVLCALGSVARSVRADPSAVPPIAEKLPEPEPGAVQRAKILFEKGVAAYTAGRYYEALEIFSETDRLYPNPQIAFNIAKAYDMLGSASGALRFYRDYLRRAPEASDRAVVEARMHELEAELAKQGLQQLSVRSDPAGAVVLLDGQPVGLTPWTGLTWPGKHQIELRHAEYANDRFMTEVEPHRSAEVKVVLHPAPVAAAARPRAASLARPQSSRSRALEILTWTALATGGAALGTAVVLETTDDAYHSLRPDSAFFAGVGAAASIVGGVLLYVHAHERTRAMTAQGKVGLLLSPSSAGARFTAKF